MAKTKRNENKRERKKRRRTKERKSDGSKEDSREIGDLEWEGESSKVWRKDQEIGFSRVPQINPYFWKESKWENTNKEVVELYNRGKGRVCAKKGEDISVVKRREVYKFIEK